MWSKAASRLETYFFRKWGRGGRGPGASPGVPNPPPGPPRRLAAQNGKGGPAARSYRQKAAILARFKGNNTRRPLFFSACVGMVLVNNISARKFSRREVGGPAQRLQAAVEQLTGEHSTPTLDFFRVISAGECLVVSIVALCGAKLNSLTPLGSVGLPLLKITM